MAFNPNVPLGSHEGLADLVAINENFNQLRKFESGATEPSNLTANMIWADTTANLLKLRNEANTAWQNIWDFGNNRLPLNVLAPGELTADAGGRGKMAALYITDAKVNDVAVTKISGTITPSDTTVGQAKLKTSTGSVSRYEGGTSLLTLPGGEYGFYPRVWVTGGAGGSSLGGTAFTNTSAATLITLSQNTGLKYTYASQRYITSSGEVHWIFILRDKTTKQIISMWQAPDHPCFGNGGKPLLVPHPFGGYNSTKHEIVVLNPTNAEMEEMLAKCDVEDETLPDKDLLQVIAEEYEIDEASNAAWPTKEVTVGLPKFVKDKNGKKVPTDYRFMPSGMEVKPIKKQIPKPDYILCRKLKKK